MSTALQQIYNFRQVDQRLATSGQPDEQELELIAGAGFQVLINLALHDDPRYSLPDEEASAKKLGLKYVHIPVIFTAPIREDLLRFFQAMQRHRQDRVWVHCAANKRVSVFVGLYRHLREGAPPDEAFAPQREIWEPNAVWSEFLARMLAERPS